MVRGAGKFLVFKNDDLDEYLTFEQEAILYDIARSIQAGRARDGKTNENFYMVVNQDEPYAEEVKAIMRSFNNWEE